jgi:2-beta-glucuronyltransferase
MSSRAQLASFLSRALDVLTGTEIRTMQNATDVKSPSASGSVISRKTGSRKSFVIMSGYHDYRSKRKANLHFIADELKRRGEVNFLSLRYSYLTRYKQDPRHDLWDCANRYEKVNDIGCYLWRTPIHPFRLPKSLALVEKAVFAAFSVYLPKMMRAVIERADIVFIESGMSIIYVRLIRTLNPGVQIIYMASDSLNAIRQASAIKQAFITNAKAIDSARVPSPSLARDIPTEIPCYYIPHGIDKEGFEGIGASPFAPGSVNAVSVGSMLFDPSFFEAAGELFPDITFHVIGSGYVGPAPDNVRYYPEMPFEKTLPFLKHSSFAVAPYGPGIDAYLTHTSMKLTQYNYLGVPAVCPELVAGEGMGRFGYRAGDRDSIKVAIKSALGAPQIVPNCHLSWCEVTDRLLEPKSYKDTWLADSEGLPSLNE